MPYERTALGPIGSEADYRVSDSVKKVRSKQTKFAPNLIYPARVPYSCDSTFVSRSLLFESSEREISKLSKT